MSRLARHIAFPFNLDDYRVTVILVDGVAEEIVEVCVLAGDAWKIVGHPSPELVAAIGEAVKEDAKAEAAQ